MNENNPASSTNTPEDPWDALDLDSDSSPLRPCNHRRHHTITTATTTLIPGPARSVQLAISRKSRDEHEMLSRGEHSDPVLPTQEYLNRVMREQMGCFDEEFTKEPWTWAVEFVKHKGLVDGDGNLLTTPLGSVRRRSITEKIDWVVAIVQSCNPNGLGDLSVTLKDPTGTINASVHHGITTEGEICRDISVGSVLILQKVAVFVPSRSASYLNITANNVVKVINKDSRPPLKQKGNESVSENLASSSGCREQPFLLQMLPPSQRGTEGIMNKLIQMNNVRASADNKNEPAQGNSAPWSSSKGTASSINQSAAVEKESQLVRQDMISEIGLETDNINDDLDILMDEQLNYACKTGKSPSSIRVCDDAETNYVEHSSNSKEKTVDNVEVKTQTVNPEGCVPEWTDEQLEELAFD